MSHNKPTVLRYLTRIAQPEVILDVKFDRRNFYNKMMHLGILTQLDETVMKSSRKEAFLFSFNKEKYTELKEKGFRLEF